MPALAGAGFDLAGQRAYIQRPPASGGGMVAPTPLEVGAFLLARVRADDAMKRA